MDIKLRIKELLRLSNRQIEDLADYMELTREGFYAIIRRNDVKKYYKIAIASFFGLSLEQFETGHKPGYSDESIYEKQVSEVKEKNIGYADDLIEMLKLRIKSLEKENADLKKLSALNKQVK